jgi:two-component sensor histidine kinase
MSSAHARSIVQRNDLRKSRDKESGPVSLIYCRNKIRSEAFMNTDTPLPPEEGATLPEQLAYRLRQQQLAADFGLFAFKTRDIPGLLQEATRVCAEGLQAKFCKALEHLPAEGKFVVVAGVGWNPGVVGHARVGADIESPTGYAFQTGEPVISNQLSKDDRFRTPQLLVEHGVHRAINVVIRGDGSPFGVLEVDSPNPGRFTSADISFLQGFANLLGAAIERQKLEEELKNKELLLEQALEQQKVLAQEIDHRVKNSLALVAGLLSMQSRGSPNPDLKRALADAEARVHTIAEVHDRLWKQGGVRTVHLDEFMNELCERFASAGPEHQFIWDIAPVMISADRAITLGLLANELITNVYKYAYPGGSGALSLTIHPHDETRLCLVVTDHGVGLPDGAQASTQGLGMKVIATLSRQLHGEAKWQSAEPGTRFTLAFVP